jgi:adenylosuccinate synthase
MDINTTVIVGGQFGDEGKGKILSYLALHDPFDVIARAGVGPNAGHTVWLNGEKFGLSMLPSGFVNRKARLLIGAGVAVNPDKLLQEITNLKVNPQQVGVDSRCTVITPEHVQADANSENSQKIGTTKTGCGPAVAARVNRIAKLAREEPRLQEFLTDVALECNQAKNVLVEATQGSKLSVLYGTYPFVTSKDTNASTALADVGIGPKKVKDVILTVKSYTTRVGAGELDNEMSPEEAKARGMAEFGTVTGRPRRISDSLNIADLRYAAMINSATQVALTKLDVKFPETKRATKYQELSSAAKEFIDDLEANLDLPVTLIGVGPEVMQIIDRR